MAMQDLKMPDEIETERLLLRRHRALDAATLFSDIESDRDRLSKELPWVKFAVTQKDSERYIEDSIADWAALKVFDYGFFLKGSDNRVGVLGVHAVSLTTFKAEIGYWMLGLYEGKGYMTEAVRALETMCFDKGFHRLEIRCSPENLKSAGVPKRLGYRLDGVLRENFLLNGVFRDTAVFSKLKTD